MKKKVRIFSTIKNELFLLSFIFFILVSLFFSSVFLFLLYNENTQNARNTLRECNSKIVTYTEGLFNENAAIVDILSQNEIIINAGYNNPSSVLNIYKDIKKNNKNITYVFSGYADGRLFIDNYSTPMDYDSTIRPWYQLAMRADDVSMVVYQDYLTKEWLFNQSKKLVDSNGNAVGVLSFDCSNENISRQLSTKYQFNSQRSYIIDQTGTILIHPDEININDSIRIRLTDEKWYDILAEVDNYAEYTMHEIPAMAYFEHIPNTDFFVVTAIDSNEVLDPIYQSIFYNAIAILLCSIILAIILSNILSHRFATPIKMLSQRIKDISMGQTSTQYENSFSNAEMLDIANSIEVIVSDISNQEERRKAAEFLSYHDSMTGLHNRRYFNEQILLLDNAENYPLGIVCCDINGLKLVNDIFGHARGDDLIVTVAQKLVLIARENDLVVRTGGDEFLLVTTQTSIIKLKKFVNQVYEVFNNVNISGAEVSISIGYALKKDNNISVNEAIKFADEMMYERKIQESPLMKQATMKNIIEVAESENLINQMSLEEEKLLTYFSKHLCPLLLDVVLESYYFRNIGKCSLLYPLGFTKERANRQHCELAYRLLSSIDIYRNSANYILHHCDKWNKTKSSKYDIPLVSKIIGITDAYISTKNMQEIEGKSNINFDPQLVKLLRKYHSTKK